MMDELHEALRWRCSLWRSLLLLWLFFFQVDGTMQFERQVVRCRKKHGLGYCTITTNSGHAVHDITPPEAYVTEGEDNMHSRKGEHREEDAAATEHSLRDWQHRLQGAFNRSKSYMFDAVSHSDHVELAI